MSEAIHLDNSKSLLNYLQKDSSDDLLLSIYLPAAQLNGKLEIERKASRLIKKADELLRPRLNKLQRKEYLNPVVEYLKRLTTSQMQSNIAIFRSPQQIYSTHLNQTPPEIAVVADSFHLKPLIESSNIKSESLLLTVTNRQICCYHVDEVKIYHKKIFTNDIDQLETDKRLGFVGQKRRTKDQLDRFISSKVKELGKIEQLKHCNIAVMGPKILRRKLIHELESQWKSYVFYESEITPSLEKMHQEVTHNLRIDYSNTDNHLALRMQQTYDQGMVCSSLKEIAEAAIIGRIETLFVDPQVQIWGIFDKSTGHILTYDEQQNHMDQCVVDDIVNLVLAQQGRVLFVDSRSHRALAPYIAIFRW